MAYKGCKASESAPPALPKSSADPRSKGPKAGNPKGSPGGSAVGRAVSKKQR